MDLPTDDERMYEDAPPQGRSLADEVKVAGPKNIGWGARGIWVRVDEIGVNFLERPFVTLTVVGADGQEPWSNVLMQGDALDLKNGAMGVSVRADKIGTKPGARRVELTVLRRDGRPVASVPPLLIGDSVDLYADLLLPEEMFWAWEKSITARLVARLRALIGMGAP